MTTETDMPETQDQELNAEAIDDAVQPSEEAVPLQEAPAADTSLEAQHAELYDQYVRLQADFENFRKRYQQEREELLKYGAERTLQNVLPVMDNLARATSSLNENSDPKMLYQSFSLMHNSLMENFMQMGLKKIDSVGQPFDPNFHEAIGRAPSDEFAEDIVMNEAQMGFMLHERVLRPAMVQVSDGSGGSSEADTQTASGNPFQQSAPADDAANTDTNA